MNKGFTVYVSPLEMDSVDHRLVELPMEQEKLDALQLELNTGSPLYTEVSDFCGREYLEEHLPEDMDLTELNLLAEKLASLEPVQEAAFEGLVRMDLDKGMTELPLCRLVDLANSADCCHVAPGIGNDEQLGHFYVDNDFPVIPPGLPEEVYEVLDYASPLRRAKGTGGKHSLSCLEKYNIGKGRCSTTAKRRTRDERGRWPYSALRRFKPENIIGGEEGGLF